jgi:hypothetical protein
VVYLVLLQKCCAGLQMLQIDRGGACFLGSVLDHKRGKFSASFRLILEGFTNFLCRFSRPDAINSQ